MPPRDLIDKFASEMEATGRAKGFTEAVRKAKREINMVLDNMLRELEVPESRTSLHKTLPPPPPPPSRPRANVVHGRLQEGKSGHALVVDMIEKHPGLKGAEVFAGLIDAGTPVHERTVRTALFRARRNGTIEQREGRWYLTKKYKEMFE